MVSGWGNTEIADIRSRIDNLFQQAQWFNTAIKDAQTAEQFNRDSTGFYTSAREGLMAMDEDLQLLREMIKNNQSKLEPNSHSFYEGECDTIDKLIGALEVFIVQPGITKEETAQEKIDGIVTKVDDGDTFYIEGHSAPIRIAGTDAPEGGTRRGEAATKFLSDLILGKKVEVRIDQNTPFDIYGRILGVPYLGDTNITLELISHCMANVNTKFGKHHFVDGDELRQAAKDCVMGWPLMGEMEINSDPPKCAIWIDGEDVQARTPYKADLTIGLHDVTVFKVGYGAVRSIIEVKEPRKKSLQPFKLQKLGADTGLIEVHANPVEAQSIIAVDNVVQGLAPAILELPISTPSLIEVTAEGYKPYSINTKAVIGRIVKLNIELNKD